MLEVKWTQRARLDTGDKDHKQNVAATEASCLVALRIARAVKSLTIAKDLLPPASKDGARIMIRGESTIQLSAISLFNDTVEE